MSNLDELELAELEEMRRAYNAAIVVPGDRSVDIPAVAALQIEGMRAVLALLNAPEAMRHAAYYRGRSVGKAVERSKHDRLEQALVECNGRLRDRARAAEGQLCAIRRCEQWFKERYNEKEREALWPCGYEYPDGAPCLLNGAGHYKAGLRVDHAYVPLLAHRMLVLGTPTPAGQERATARMDSPT